MPGDAVGCAGTGDSRDATLIALGDGADAAAARIAAAPALSRGHVGAACADEPPAAARSTCARARRGSQPRRRPRRRERRRRRRRPRGNATWRRRWISAAPTASSKSPSDGTVAPPGTVVFAAQHNAEYFGEGEYLLFDNHGDAGGSRLLALRVDERARRARVVWEHALGVVSDVFGDHDRMPTGNSLGSLWGATWGTNRTESGGMDAMARIVEVARPSHEVAWSLDVVGPPCPSAACEQKDDSGWHMYSVRRFFGRPRLQRRTPRRR